MKFKVTFIFPVIIFVLALVSVFYLTEIEPFNYVIAAVVVVIALAMAWRIYYDFVSERESSDTTAEYEPSARVTGLIKESPKESKIRLDDFLRSSPKDLKETGLGKGMDLRFQENFSPEEKNPFSFESSGEEEKYKAMKEKALKELKDVIKPKKNKKNNL